MCQARRVTITATRAVVWVSDEEGDAESYETVCDMLEGYVHRLCFCCFQQKVQAIDLTAMSVRDRSVQFDEHCKAVHLQE